MKTWDFPRNSKLYEENHVKILPKNDVFNFGQRLFSKKIKNLIFMRN